MMNQGFPKHIFGSAAIRIAFRFAVLVAVFTVGGGYSAFAAINITPVTWNVIGLDSNNVTVGPNIYPVGARVCNPDGAAVTNVVSNFVWDSTNAFINIDPGATATQRLPTLAAGACADFYYDINITRSSLAYNATRRYRITAVADGVSSVNTPAGREFYVEKLVSQNRNTVQSISGPTTVYVGQTYTYTVNASTATGGYEQLEAFLNLSNVVFRVLSIATTYTAPPGATNDKIYGDACGWINDPLSPAYRSCIGTGKVGNSVRTIYTVQVLSTGTTQATTLIYDYSGSSYHYNSDFGDQIISITALPPLSPDLTIAKSHTGNFTAGSPGTYNLTVTNSGNAATSGTITVADTLPAGLTVNGGAAGAVTPTGANAANWSCASNAASPQVITCTSSTTISNTTGSNTSAFSLTVNVASNAPASVTNNVSVAGGGELSTATGNNTASDPTTINPGFSLTGIVFEDVNYAGGSGRSLLSASGSGRGGARVELYNSAGNFLSAATTATTGTVGQYQFLNLAAGTYTVRVVNSTVTSSRTGAVSTLIGVQTFRTNGGTADTNRVGGENPLKIDAAANTTSATLASLTTTTAATESISSATISTANITGVDFGYNFDTVVNVNDSGQGSLRQFIINANALSGADVSIFMISDGAARSGMQAGLPNQLTGGVANIILASLLPAVTDALTTIDGTTQTTNVGNTNSGSFGTGGTVGVDNLSLSTVQRPEVQITDGAANLTIGLDLQGTNETVRGISIYGFGTTANNDANANIRLGASAANALIEQNIIGTTATAFADPGSGTRSGGDNVRSLGADNGVLRNNLIGFSAGKGFGAGSGSSGWLIENNEIRGNGIGNPNLDGIDLETAGSINNTVRGNLIYDNEGVGVDSSSSNGSNTVVNNTITGNGAGAGATVETAGVRMFGANNTIDRNRIFANYGAGVMVASGASANTITRNSIFANGTILTKTGGAASNQIGIDLLSAADNQSTGTTGFVTLNDSGDGDTGGNGLLNFPVLETAQFVGGNLVLKGFARPGAALEFFIAAPDASGFGEGQTYLLTLTEGAAQDTDATTGTYTSPFGGKNVGTDTTNRFQFTISVPAGVSSGTILTATATLGAATSEFSNTIAAANQPPIIGLVKSVSPNGTQMPGAELIYNIAFTNSGGTAATGFAITDPNPGNATLRLNTNTDFKVGSVVNVLGTTGLTATITYSNDNAATFGYTPVSAGGGASAGFDRNVTHVRWTFAGSLSQTAPNNTGNVSFAVRIR